MNQINLIGNMTRDPELRTIGDNKQLCKFTLACSGRRKDQTVFFDCVVWDKAAGLIVQYCEKGSKLYVSGEHKPREYVNKDGINRKVWEVTVDAFEFLGGKNTKRSNRDEMGYPMPTAPDVIPDEDEEECPF